jgi:ADP-heptose:LPS heptosyltransferase
MNIVVFKNDAVGDLVHSLDAINNITSNDENKKITIFLSNFSRRFSFLIQSPKVEFRVLNYRLKIIERIKLIFFLKKNNIKKVYILSPKNFYYFLPLIFRKIKFYAICVNSVDNYKRPSLFLRKFLYKYEINHRENIFKRESTKLIQKRLTSDDDIKFNFNIRISRSKILNDYLPKKYIYFHHKKKLFNELKWNFEDLQILFSEFSKYCENIVLTKDIDGWRGDKKSENRNDYFKKTFNTYDFRTNTFSKNKSNILFLDNIKGEDLFNVIKSSTKVVAFHGMMTNLAYLLNKPVLDLFHCKINNWDDYRSYRNSFYEFKPQSINYDFTIPKKNMEKTLKKIRFSLIKCLKK